MADDLLQVHQVLQFSRNHNYLLAIDEQTVWFMVKQTQAGMALDADYTLISLLIQFDVIYKIQVSDANRNAVLDPYKGEKISQILKELVNDAPHPD